ncbi:MAG: MBL fold metallo-hydrolase [Eggerthellaceae bacterium]|jgi:hydroxyacylglutathione hydrolase
MHEVFPVSTHVRHIQEIGGSDPVFFSVAQGSRSALVVDTAYGVGDTRGWVDQNVSVPYRVINTHGHLDHVQGNSQFEEAWIHPADLPAYDRANSRMMRLSTFFQFGLANGLPKSAKDAFITAPQTVMHALDGNERFDLGGVHVRVVELPGHTKGEIGLLVEEDRLLLSGDSFSDDCFMFGDNHDSLETLASSLEKALALPFDAYLGSHTHETLPREFLATVLQNARQQRVVPGSEEVINGVETLTIQAEGPYGVSKIRIPASGAEA